MKPIIRLVAVNALAGVACSIVFGQAVWPLERYDRWGTGKQPNGPAVYIQPWKGYRIHSPGNIVSCGAVIGEDGAGYFTTWQQSRVNKFDVETGALLGSFNALNFVCSMAAIGLGDNLYCVTSSGGSSRFFELNRQSMDFNWFQPTTSTGQGDYYHAAAIIGPDGNAYIGNESGQFRCYQAGAGTVKWSRQLAAPIFRTAAFTRTDNQVIASGGTWIYSLRPSGKLDWSKNIGSQLGAPGVSPSNTIVVGSNQGIVYGLNPISGATLWIRPTLARVYAAPAFDVVNGVEVAYVASEDQSVYCIRVSDGVRLWTFSASSPFRNPAIVDNLGFVYAKTASGTLYKISPQGAGIWQIQFNGTSRGPMTMGDDGTIFIGMDGNDSLYAVRQTPALQAADNFSIADGLLTAGSLAETFSSDDQYLSISSDVRRNEIRANFVVTSPANGLHKLRARLELASIKTARIATIRLWNALNGRWETVAKASISSTDEQVLVNVPSNATRFVANGSREVKMQITLAERSPSPVSRPSELLVDEVRFEFEPVFQL